eukprot:gene32144-16669_t
MMGGLRISLECQRTMYLQRPRALASTGALIDQSAHDDMAIRPARLLKTLTLAKHNTKAKFEAITSSNMIVKCILSVMLLSFFLCSADLIEPDTSNCPDGAQAIFDLANYHRELHGVPSLVWNEDLVDASRAWAKVLGTPSNCGGPMSHSGDRKNVGENIYKKYVMSSGDIKATAINCTEGQQSWYDEIEYYTFDTDTPATTNWYQANQIGHFTQAVWKSTTDIGCYADRSFFVNENSWNGYCLWLEYFKDNVLPLVDDKDTETPDHDGPPIDYNQPPSYGGDQDNEPESDDTLIVPDNSNCPEGAGALLDLANKHRALHGVPPLFWNEDLVASATAWGETIKTEDCSGALRHSENRVNVGENLYDEIKDYNFDTPTPIDNWYDAPGPIGHFTQQIWKSTTDIGCAAMSSNFISSAGWNGLCMLLVCHYGPQGNSFTNQAFIDNVLPLVTP